ncbi:universal stress protein [Roseovarius dicentrarchi]|uniref:universal stress protein n=1 Tax=Roseovarius dicentrarchi TaxID=2250573 RepID=UPI000DEBE60D|nr:universal stress protein [Roseovarius dicentrarchi]
MYKHILIPHDGSELSMKGVQQGLGLAKELGAQVTIAVVSQPYPLQSAATVDSWAKGQKDFVEDVIAKAKAAAKDMGIEVDAYRATNASAADAIIDAAATMTCDLIVMASHGRRGISRLLLGSQTSEVVSHSPIPVLVVR